MIPWKKPDAETRWLMALILLGTAYYWVFEISVMVPQTGWWHYMGWRTLEGDLPYRDFYLFLPPYYILFTAGLYAMFGNHMFPYTVVGFLLTRVLAWCMLYRVLVRKIRPPFAFLSVFAGLCLTSTYLMDQVYDYNPTVYMLTIALALAALKFSEAETPRQEIISIGLAGIISGVLFMTKQTVGLFYPVFCPMVIAAVCRLKGGRALKKIGVYFAAAAAGAAPGVIYILANGLAEDMIHCLVLATQAKTGQGSLILLTIRNFIYPKELSLAVLLALNLYWFRVYRAKFRSRHPRYAASLADALLAGGAAAFTIYCLFPSISAVLRTAKLMTHVEYAVVVVAWLCGAFILFLADYRILKKRGAPSRRLRTVMAALAVVSLFCAIRLPQNFQQFFNAGINFRVTIRLFLTVMLYLDLLLLLYLLWLVARKKRRDLTPVTSALTIILAFHLLVFMSAVLEENFAMTIAGVFIAVALEYSFPHRAVQYWKNAAITAVCVVLCIACLAQKVMVPYEWHGWQVSRLYDAEDPMTPPELETLRGFWLPEYDTRTYESICALIEKYSGPGDVVFQFPHITLFNVLTERQTIPYYTIPYFDVMPDSLAEEAADYLWENPPRMTVWAEMTEGRWRAHENAYRGGMLSGQRAIQRWHDGYAASHYRRVDVFPNINASGDSIEVWAECAFAGGMATERIVVSPEQPVAEQYGAFTEDRFQKYVLMIPDDVSVPAGQTMRVDLYDGAGALVESTQGELVREDREYWSLESDHAIRVTPGETYRMRVSFPYVPYSFQIGVSSPGTASEDRYCLCYGEPAPRSFNLSLFCE